MDPLETKPKTIPPSSAPSKKPTADTRASAPATPSLIPLTDAMDEGFDALRRSVRLKTMWPLMQRLCPPRSERFWVIGGRPGNYKTQLVWNLAVDMALLGQRVLFVTMEQTSGELGVQATVRHSRIPMETLEWAQSPGGSLGETHMRGLSEAADKNARTEMYLRLHDAEKQGRSIDSIMRSATRTRFEAIFVDHLGMIGRDSGGNKFEVLEHAIDKLRGLSRGQVLAGYRPFVCVLSPLNRDGEKEKDDDKPRLPRMSDFSGSSRIESDADLAMVLRKRKNEGDQPIDIVDGFVLKNRQGRCPLVLQFEAQGALCTVTERHKEDAPNRGHWSEKDE